MITGTNGEKIILEYYKDHSLVLKSIDPARAKDKLSFPSLEQRIV